MDRTQKMARARKDAISELEAVLLEIPSTEEKRAVALAKILEAVSEFNEAHPFDEANNPVSKFGRGLADVRKDLRKIVDKPDLSRDDFNALPLATRRLLAQASKTPGTTFGALGQNTASLAGLAQGALRKLENAEHKPPHHARNFLASDVARVMREVLGIEPTNTRDGFDTRDGHGTNAPYARLLRATFKMGGISQFSIGRQMGEGLLLLGNPNEARGDHHDPADDSI